MIERRQVMSWLVGTIPEDELLVTPPAHVFNVEEIGRGKFVRRQSSLAL